MPPKPTYEDLLQRIIELEQEILSKNNEENTSQQVWEKYQIVFEKVDLALALIQDGCVKFCNPKLTKVLGVSEEELTNKPITTFIHPKDRAQVSEYYLNRLKNHDVPKSYSFRVLDQLGTLRWAEVNVVQIKWENKPASVCSFSDITEKKQAEAALLESEQKYRSLYDNIPIGVYRATPDGYLKHCNPAFSKIIHFPQNDDITQYNVEEFYKFPEERQRFIEIITKDKVVINFEIEARSFKDEKKFVSINAVSVKDRKGNICYDGTVEDITQRKLAEREKDKLEKQIQQAQKMEALGVLAGGISHDFNNILSALMGFTDLAKLEAGENHTLTNYLNSVSAASLRARELVRHILTFSRKTEIVRQPIHIIPIVKETLKFIRSSLPADIEIHQDLRVTQAQVFGDASQLHQILMNLFTNAGYAMKDNGGILKVVLHKKNVSQSDVLQFNNIKPGRYINLVVSDNGCGISKDHLDRIYEPFFTTKKREEGTGMGLSTVYGIIQELGGTISAHSELGRGTTFNLFIPEDQRAYKRAEIRDTDLKIGDGKILLVDDEVEILEAVKEILSRLGYKVSTAENGYDALKQIDKSPLGFDLILTDLTMPGISGLELSRQIQKRNPGLPIVLCTGFSHSLTKEKCKSLGIVDLVMKPLIASEISMTVYKALQNNAKGEKK